MANFALHRLPRFSKHIVCLALVIGFLSGTALPAFAAVDKDQAKKDWEELAKLTTQYQREFMSQSNLKAKDLNKGSTVWYGGKTDKDIRTGDITNKAYHFKKLSEEEGQYILDNVK